MENKPDKILVVGATSKSAVIAAAVGALVKAFPDAEVIPTDAIPPKENIDFIIRAYEPCQSDPSDYLVRSECQTPFPRSRKKGKFKRYQSF